jgi:transcriptional regulator with XRE-family HTH domain
MDSIIHLDLGLALKYIRLKKTYSLRQLSSDFLISHTLISKIEMSKLGLSKEIQSKYRHFFQVDFEIKLDLEEYLNSIFQKLTNGIIYHNEALIHECVDSLRDYENDFKYSIYQIYHDYLATVSSIHVNRSFEYNESLWMELSPYLPPHLNYWMVLSISHSFYLNYRFKEALNLMAALTAKTWDDKYQGLIYEKQSAIMFFQYNHHEAIGLNEVAYQIFSAENIIVRMTLCEIRNDLFKKALSLNADETDYKGLISKAVQFNLYFMVDTIHFIKGLRHLHNHDFPGFLASFKAMESRTPVYYLYYGLGLYIMNDLKTLRQVLKKRPLNNPTTFEYGFYALEKSLELKKTDVKAFKAYLDRALTEKSHEDTILIKCILETHYLNMRQYKEAYNVLDTVLETVLKP